MYSQEEKILILGALFHDIGKFVQRCEKTYESHTSLGKKLLNDELDYFQDKSFDLCPQFKKILGNSDENYNGFLNIILNHHSPNNDLEKIVQQADHISASERPELQKEESNEDIWKHKFLSSIFSKLKLLPKEEVNNEKLYFKQKVLVKDNYDSIIPNLTSIDDNFKYNLAVLESFRKDLYQILKFYRREEDFATILNLILILFEKYMWCIPDFTGSDETDISLFNHSKDVCGLSLALYKSKKDSEELLFIVGDIPGIQNYIFDLYSAKGVAKILRGRSIFVQVLSRNFATIFLNNLGLTEANLVMLAGGKFYIIAQNSDDFEELFKKTNYMIEEYLWKQFNGELSFNSASVSFNYNDLKDKKITFGNIVENANKELQENKRKLFEKILFSNKYENFIIENKYIDATNNDTNNIKCKLTNKPIIVGQQDNLPEIGIVNKQIKTEWKIGDMVTDNNILVEFEAEGMNVKEIFNLKDFNGSTDNQKILINPDLEKILEIINNNPEKIDFLRNSRFIDVACHVKKESDESVMPFEDLVKLGEGAEYLAMIKADIDNLGLLMAYGLDRDKSENTLSAISRTTTLSNHLKYFFSFYLDNFVNENFQNTYTVFAGGDDMLLICHQSEAVKLVNEFNNKFTEFTCSNPEIHISYSITHFKDHTPVKLVNIFADENQETVKKEKKSLEIQEGCFEKDTNKASTFIFNTKVKNTNLADLTSYEYILTKWVKENEIEKNKGISMGTLRNLLQLMEILKNYRESGDTSKLIWHPLLTYMINRNLKRDGNYKDQEVGIFFDKVLSINNEDKEKDFEKILYPAICGAIYKLRKS
ncbi:MAG: type III-A CRISPR-associated protein Cas10/Csm1 [Ignavibacteria bacterium]|nr:type III-A CRISPR-associated protein Cas10/Csm1 [Ignavibacteria bacterium]